jgi:hypothetical protein
VTGGRVTVVHVRTGTELLPVVHSMLRLEDQAPNVVRFLYDAGLAGTRPWDWGERAGRAVPAAGALPAHGAQPGGVKETISGDPRGIDCSFVR